MAEESRKAKIERLKSLVPQLKHETHMEYNNKIKKILGYLEDEDFAESVKQLYGFEDSYEFTLFRDEKSAKKNYINDSLMIIKARETYHEKGNKGFLKHLKRFFIVAGSMIFISSFMYGGTVGLTKLYAATAQVDCEQVQYYQNESVEPGYYNENPIKVCISDQFNSIFRSGIEKGIKTFDDAATGIKFEIRCGDLKKLQSEYDVSFQPVTEHKTENGMDILGYTYLSSLDAKKISGPIFIDQSKIHLFGVKSTAMHELGHMIGLSHSPDPNSLMFPYCVNYNLSQSDIDNINTIYPAVATGVENSEPSEELPAEVKPDDGKVTSCEVVQPNANIHEEVILPEEYER